MRAGLKSQKSIYCCPPPTAAAPKRLGRDCCLNWTRPASRRSQRTPRRVAVLCAAPGLPPGPPTRPRTPHRTSLATSPSPASLPAPPDRSRLIPRPLIHLRAWSSLLHNPPGPEFDHEPRHFPRWWVDHHQAAMGWGAIADPTLQYQIWLSDGSIVSQFRAETTSKAGWERWERGGTKLSHDVESGHIPEPEHDAISQPMSVPQRPGRLKHDVGIVHGGEDDIMIIAHDLLRSQRHHGKATIQVQYEFLELHLDESWDDDVQSDVFWSSEGGCCVVSSDIYWSDHFGTWLLRNEGWNYVRWDWIPRSTRLRYQMYSGLMTVLRSSKCVLILLLLRWVLQVPRCLRSLHLPFRSFRRYASLKLNRADVRHNEDLGQGWEGCKAHSSRSMSGLQLLSIGHHSSFSWWRSSASLRPALTLRRRRRDTWMILKREGRHSMRRLMRCLVTCLSSCLIEFSTRWLTLQINWISMNDSIRRWVLRMTWKTTRSGYERVNLDVGE